MKLVALTLLFYFNSVFAFEQHTAYYQLSINDFKIAEEVRVLHKIDNQYFYTANAKTSGVAALIKDYSIAASSTFAVNAQGVDAANYQIIEQEGGKFAKNYVIDISSKNNMAMSALTKTQPKIITWKAKQGNIVDPLSLFLALSYDLENNSNQSKFSYQVANGKSIEQQQYQKISDQEISISDQALSVIKIKRVDNDADMVQIYFAPKYQYLPVLIEQNKQGKKYQYRLVSFKTGQIEKN